MILTGKATDGRQIIRGSDSQYRLANPLVWAPEGWTTRVRAFLSWLVDWLGPDPHDYERLYFACQEIHNELSGESENPLIRPFIKECAIAGRGVEG